MLVKTLLASIMCEKICWLSFCPCWMSCCIS